MADETLLDSLSQQREELTNRAQSQISDYQNALGNLSSAKGGGATEEEIATIQASVDDAKALVDETKDQIKLVDQQLDAALDPSPTLLSNEEVEAELRQQTTEIVGENEFPTDTGGTPNIFGGLKNAIGTAAGLLGKVLFGGIAPKPGSAQVTFRNSQGDVVGEDLRVKILVPQEYWTDLTAGPNQELAWLKGIIFPFTPSISYETKADYTSMSPLHSNFNIYFYKNSSVSPIKVSGKFTVQNDKDAAIYLSTVHLLRSLTKMRTGGLKSDPLSGSPPPICRLEGYGDIMLKNIPVVISSFQVELPDNVDYYTVGKQSSYLQKLYGLNSVPIISTISVTCTPMYSRSEMQKFNVNDYVDGKYKKVGYL